MSENPQDQDPEVDFEENDIEPQGEVDETEPIDPRFRPAENMPEFNLAALPTGTIPQVIFITRFKWATTTEKKVRELLEPFGPLKSVHMKPKSAFVEFINVEDAHKAKHTLHCRPGLESDSLIVDFKQDNREVKVIYLSYFVTFKSIVNSIFMFRSDEEIGTLVGEAVSDLLLFLTQETGNVKEIGTEIGTEIRATW